MEITLTSFATETKMTIRNLPEGAEEKVEDRESDGNPRYGVWVNFEDVWMGDDFDDAIDVIKSHL